jgi:hypothetical protein
MAIIFDSMGEVLGKELGWTKMETWFQKEDSNNFSIKINKKWLHMVHSSRKPCILLHLWL